MADFLDRAVYVPDWESWREWLHENHDREKEVWVILYKKHTGKPTLSYEECVEGALCFGWVDSAIRRIDGEKHAQKFTPRKVKGTWSTSNKKRVERLLKEGLMAEAGLESIRIAKENGSWDTLPVAEQTIEMSEQFRAALEANPPAYEFFNGLAPSYRKEYIVWTATAKREQTRERRVREALRLLSEGKKLDEK